MPGGCCLRSVGGGGGANGGEAPRESAGPVLDDDGETLGLISFDEPDECPASPDIPDEHAKGNANTARSDLLSQQFQTLKTKRQRQTPRNTKLVQKRNVQGPEGQNTNTRTHPAPANVLPVQPASRLPLFHDTPTLC